MREAAIQRSRRSRHLEWAIKSAFGLAFSVLLYHLLSTQDLSATYKEFRQIPYAGRWPWLLIVLACMVLNWGLETIKWRLLLRPLILLAFRVSLQSVLVGLATSLFTPNRIGEYVGRVWLTPSGQRWQAAAALLLGSFIQLVLIGLTGAASIWYLLQFDTGVSILTQPWHWITLIFLVAFGGVAFFHVGTIIHFLKARLPGRWLKKGLRYFLFYRQYSMAELWQIMTITTMRLSLYALQYFFLLRFFGVDLAWQASVAAIFTCYFVQSTLPIPPFIALIARGEIAILVWNSLSVNELSVLAASYSLWVINVLLPALVGMILVLKMNILKTVDYGTP